MQKDPLIGTQLGTYLIQSKLGEGGMARVYKAYHARLRREVAMKVILPQIVAEPGFRERFEREAQVIASLEHPNIVAVYDFGEIGDITYLVMQYVGGGTLRDQLRGEYPLEPRQAGHYAIQMARALHKAHQQGIVHRDVKPQNMLISANDSKHLLLSDFGIAKLFDSRLDVTSTAGTTGRSSDASLTNIGQIVGTAEYMAPEQVNMQPVDARTDVYALGVVLYQMLTGQVPFHSTTIQGLLYQHVYTPPRPLQEVNPYVPEPLARVTMHALEKVPQNRFQTAEEMAQALEVVVGPVTNQLSAPLSNYGAIPSGPMSYPWQPPADQPFNSSYGRPTFPSAVEASQGTVSPRTTTGGGSVAVPVQQPARKKVPISTVAISGLIVLAVIVAIFWRYIPFPGSGPGTSSKVATSFTENFQDNSRGWPLGANGHTIASLANHTYTLQIDGGVTTLDYLFPHPDSNIVGTLPANFTLAAAITETRGGTTALYGIAFHLKQDDTQGKIYCYALVINSNGDYQVWRYDADAPTRPQIIWQGQQASFIHTGLNQQNTLQVSASGNTYSFRINNQTVPLGLHQESSTSDPFGTPFTDGLLALMVTGPNTTFAISSVQLTVS